MYAYFTILGPLSVKNYHLACRNADINRRAPKGRHLHGVPLLGHIQYLPLTWQVLVVGIRPRGEFLQYVGGQAHRGVIQTKP